MKLETSTSTSHNYLFGRRCALLRFCLCLSILPSCFFLCLSTLPPFLTSPTVLPPFILSFDLPSPPLLSPYVESKNDQFNLHSPIFVEIIYPPSLYEHPLFRVFLISSQIFSLSIHSGSFLTFPKKMSFLKHENIIALKGALQIKNISKD